MPFSISSLGIVFYRQGLPVDVAPTLGLRQILVTPGVRADGVPGCSHLLENAGLVGRVQADREEDRLGAVRGECGKHRLSVLRPGPVVEGQHHFAFAQEIVGLELLGSKAGATGGVDLDHPADPQSVGIAFAGGHRLNWRERRRRRSLGGDHHRRRRAEARSVGGRGVRGHQCRSLPVRGCGLSRQGGVTGEGGFLQ
jgi:hypothetical protein